VPDVVDLMASKLQSAEIFILIKDLDRSWVHIMLSKGGGEGFEGNRGGSAGVVGHMLNVS
jgi:hypothetical protein